jgi:hypothetical protein
LAHPGGFGEPNYRFGACPPGALFGHSAYGPIFNIWIRRFT